MLVTTGLGHDRLERVAEVGWGQVAAGEGGWGTMGVPLEDPDPAGDWHDSP